MNTKLLTPYTQVDFTLFEYRPGIGVVLLPNDPVYTLVAVSRDFISTSGMKKEDVIGKSHFEVFPENPDDPQSSGEHSLRSSFEYILRHKKPHGLPLLRYDIPNGDGTFSEKYWKSSNAPVLNEDGEVVYIIHTAEDVTSQVKADKTIEEHKVLETAFQRVEESELKYRRLFDSIDQGFCVLEMIFDGDHQPIDYRFLETNPAFEEQTGLKGAIGKTAREMVPNLESHWFELYGKVATTGEPLRFIERSDAMGRWFDVFAYRIENEGSSKVGLLFRDITDRKKMEEALKENEVLLQKRVVERTADLDQQKALVSTILDASLGGIYALKAVRSADGLIADFQYLFANKHIGSFLHRDVKQIIGASMLQLIPENKDNGFFDLFCKLLQTGKTFRDETHFVAQQIDRWFDYVIVPIDADTLVVYIEDITAKKESVIQVEEQRNLLDSILRNSSNGISVSEVFRDENDKVVDALTILANEAAVKYTGIPRDIYLSKRATEIEPAVMDSPYYHACIKTLETGEPFIMQYQLESTGRWLELTVSRLDRDHLIQIFTDITPIKESQLQLERTVENLKRSNQNLEEFAYAASHDMKEPIRKIHFFADRLKERLLHKLEEEDRRYFERLEAGTQRMTTLIDDLLLYSHVNRGIASVETVDMNQMLSFVLDDLELHIEQKGAKIEAGPLPTIKGRPRQLQQLFENLVGNALKYNKPNVTPHITISSNLVKGSDVTVENAAIDKDKMYHLISVEDNGIGFPQEEAERIFNVFTRLHGNAEYRGSGVGLSIVQKIVANHRGHVWAKSTPGEGAVFYVLLPASLDDSDRQ